MAFTGLDHAKAVDLIVATAFEPERWLEVLPLLAKAGGGWSAQVLGWNATAQSAAFNFVDGLLSDLMDEWIAYGGLDPVLNPRARLWMQARQMLVFGENSLSTEAERNQKPIYAELYRRSDAPFSAGAIFDRQRGVTSGVAVIRSRSQGDADEEAARHLRPLLPHLRSALRLRAVLDDEAAALAVGALEALHSTTILCNRLGQVVGATALAEDQLRRRDVVRAVSGRLEACDSSSDLSLQAAIALAGRTGNGLPMPPQSSVILRSLTDGRPCVADVAPLPGSPFSLRLGGVLLVSLRMAGPKRPLDLVKRAFSLSDAEADVAQRLASGARMSEIAGARGVTVETVRNQVKAIFAKLNVASQVDLVRAVSPFLNAQDE